MGPSVERSAALSFEQAPPRQSEPTWPVARREWGTAWSPPTFSKRLGTKQLKASVPITHYLETTF